MAKKDKVDLPPEEEKVYEKGMVLYSDGGSRWNGFGGWGLHGYKYTMEPTTKGSGNPTHIPTIDGYVAKKDKTDLTTEVKLESYFDGFGSFMSPTTNNQAEIMGAVNGFSLALRHPDVTRVKLYTDSQYVVVGANDWIHKWKSNGYLKKDGTPIGNKPEWLLLEQQLDAVKEKNINWSVEWVKGHAGNLGNEMADKGATIGVMHSRANILRSETDVTPAQGYWSTKKDKHPFLSIRRCYFLTNTEYNIPGQYFLGDHGKDDDIMGKKQPGIICYVELNEPDNLIEVVKKKQLEECKNENVIALIRLDILYDPKIAEGLNKYNELFLMRDNRNRVDLSPVTAVKDSRPNPNSITKGIVPPKIAIRTLDGIAELKGVLTAWKEGDKKLITTQITDSLFVKDKKGELKLIDKITASDNLINVKISYGQPNELKEYDLELYLGQDIPDRNTFKKIESMSPEVYLLTWMESDQCFKYATIIKINSGIGIWSSISSNLKFIPAD